MTVRLTPIESDNTSPTPTPTAPGSRLSVASDPVGRPLVSEPDEAPTIVRPIGSGPPGVEGIDVTDGPGPDDEVGARGHTQTGEQDGPVAEASARLQPSDDADHSEARPDSRITLREARRTRRRTAWLCAAVVILALALTIAVVSLARARPPQGAAPAVTVSLSVHSISSATVPWRSGV